MCLFYFNSITASCDIKKSYLKQFIAVAIKQSCEERV